MSVTNRLLDLYTWADFVVSVRNKIFYLILGFFRNFIWAVIVTSTTIMRDNIGPSTFHTTFRYAID